MENEIDNDNKAAKIRGEIVIISDVLFFVLHSIGNLICILMRKRIFFVTFVNSIDRKTLPELDSKDV